MFNQAPRLEDVYRNGGLFSIHKPLHQMDLSGHLHAQTMLPVNWRLVGPSGKRKLLAATGCLTQVDHSVVQSLVTELPRLSDRNTLFKFVMQTGMLLTESKGLACRIPSSLLLVFRHMRKVPLVEFLVTAAATGGFYRTGNLHPSGICSPFFP